MILQSRIIRRLNRCRHGPYISPSASQNPVPVVLMLSVRLLCFVRQCRYLRLHRLDCLGDQCHVYSISCALRYTTARLRVLWSSQLMQNCTKP